MSDIAVTPMLRLSGEERRAEIVDAVLRLSAERSPGLITTAEIARALSLSQGALFKHFPRKEDIWLAVAERIAESLLATVEQAAQQAASPLAALHGIFMAHVGFVIEHPGAPRFIFHELQRSVDSPVKSRLREMLARYRQILMGLLETAEQQGELAEGTNKSAAASLFLGSIQGLVMQSMLAGSSAAMRQQAEAILPIFERGIRREKSGEAA
ncbi:MAG: TetR/AcrR family transcriptional regulator [Azonexus sp.]|nr:TetR/AcrR family transcriptional regulator [Azonexus sp.]